MKISLRTIEDVKEFVTMASGFKGDIEVRSGRFIVDAKSLLGVFSLNLSEPVEVTGISNLTDEQIAELKKFAV